MLLTALHILPITDDPLQNGAILVRDGRIADIGDAEKLKLRYPEEEVRDFGTSVLLPGFIDLHTHLEYSVMRGLIHDVPYATWLMQLNSKDHLMTLQDWRDSALFGGLEALSSGITCIADITNTGASLLAADKLGLRAVIYREVGAMDKKRVDHAMYHAESDIDEWKTGLSNPDLVQVGIAPYALYTCHPSVFRRVADLAGDEMPVAIHMAGSREEYRFIKYGSSQFSVHGMDAQRGYVEVPPWLPTGVTPVRYALNWGAFDPGKILAIHCVQVEEEDVLILKNHDVAIATCPRCNAQLGMGVAPLNDYLKLGMRVGLGTDSPAATDSTDMMSEMRIGMLVHRAVDRDMYLTSHNMLEMATIGAARALNMENEIGSLEIGKRADIIAVDMSGTYQTPATDPIPAIVNTASGSDVSMTMVNGKILYEPDQWHVDVEVAKSIGRVIGIRGKLRS